MNSGNSNIGDHNTGNWNSGDYNTGDWNSGNRNSGRYNIGSHNSGNTNLGDFNTGDWNSGNYNSGNCNIGYMNSGNRNSGNGNRGNFNSGDFNGGDFNNGDFNRGAFNTESMPTIKMFDKDSNWTMEDWRNSIAFYIMSNCPTTHSDFIYESRMSEEEKENHPEYKTLGGYTKIVTVTAEDKQKWWDDLIDWDKQEVMSLPNFDADKFYQCTEIRVRVQ